VRLKNVFYYLQDYFLLYFIYRSVCKKLLISLLAANFYSFMIKIILQPHFLSITRSEKSGL
jgi:hypothetical protein